MIEWRDDGPVLRARPHGETGVILEVFTRAHGRAAGVVRGGTSRRLAPLLQPGTELQVTWKARLEEHLGAFTVEPLKSRAAQVMADRAALAGLKRVTGLLPTCCRKARTPHRLVRKPTEALLTAGGQCALASTEPHKQLRNLKSALGN